MKHKIKNVILKGFHVSGIAAIMRYVSRNSLRVLAYHGVDDGEGIVNADGFFVPCRVFAEQLNHIARNYRVLSLSEVAVSIRENKPWPERSVLITFDDGYLNNYRCAGPILTAHKIPAVFFATTGFIDRTHRPWWFVLRQWIREAGFSALGVPPEYVGDPPCNSVQCILCWEIFLKGLTEKDRTNALAELGRKLGLPEDAGVDFMDWEHLGALLKQGHAVEPHTVSHINLGKESAMDVRQEIVSSISRLNEKLGVQARAYAYPYGRHSDVQASVFDALGQAGIRIAFTTVHGFNQAGSNSLMMRRLNITGHHIGPAFEKLLAVGR